MKLRYLALLIPLAGCAGDVSFKDQLGTAIKSSAGSAEIDVKDIANGCHDWHAQGSITLMDVNITCKHNADGTFDKSLSVKSADPLQQLIEANKNQQAMTAQLLTAFQQLLTLVKP